MFRAWLQQLVNRQSQSSARRRRRTAHARRSLRMCVEPLEVRALLAASLVDDIFPGPAPNSSDPTELVNVGGTLYFSANDGGGATKYGIELWRSDGTAAGTGLAADVDRGPASSQPGDLTNVNGKLYFTVNRVYQPPSFDSGQLYVHDPADGGTNKIMNYSGALQQIAGAHGLTFFTISDSINFTSLWRTDGTRALNDGSPDPNHTFKLMTFGGVSELTGTQNLVLFSAATADKGAELWQSNGSVSGTTLRQDINKEAPSSIPSHLTRLVKNQNEYVFFSASDAAAGNELWVTDLGPGGATRRVTEIIPGPGGSNPSNLTDLNGVLYFDAFYQDDQGQFHDVLWQTNADFTDVNKVMEAEARELTNVDGALYFKTGTGTLWSITPQDSNPRLVMDFGSQSIGDFRSWNGKLAFTVLTPSGRALWQSNGTSTTTVPVGVGPGFSSEAPGWLTAVDTTLFFRATDAPHGAELWKAGPTLVFFNMPDPTGGDGGDGSGRVFSSAGSEAITRVSLPVSVSEAPDQPITVHYRVQPGGTTATGGGVDYTLNEGDLTFSPNGPTTLTVPMTIVDDAIWEPSETIRVELSAVQGSGATLLSGGLFTYTILDNDAQVVIGDASITEGKSGSTTLNFSVSLLQPISQDVTLGYHTENGTALYGYDYVLTQGPLEFHPGGPTVIRVAVPVYGDLVDEYDETFKVKLADVTNAVIADDTGIGTIIDDDAPPTVRFELASSQGAETDSVPEIWISLSAASEKIVEVDYSRSGTAIAEQDYHLDSGPLRFNPLETRKRLPLTILDDAGAEDSESIQFRLTGAANASLASSNTSYTYTILDNERVFFVYSFLRPRVWEDPLNWSLNALPTPSQEVNLWSPEVSLSSAVSIKKLQAPGNSRLDILGGSLVVAESSVVYDLGLAGNLAVGGDLSIKHGLDWSSGTLSVSGVTSILGDLTLRLSTAKYLLGSELRISGAVAYDGRYTAPISTLNGGTVANLASNTIDLSDDGAFGGFFVTGTWKFNNYGTLRKQTGSGVATVKTDFNNMGTVDVQAGTLSLAGALGNFSNRTLTGGSYQLKGTLVFIGADLGTNAANITLDGTSSKILNQGGANALANLTANAAGASLTLSGGRDLSTAKPLTNAGTVTLNSGSTLTVHGNYTQSTGVTNLNLGSTLTVYGNYTQTAATGLTNLSGGTLNPTSSYFVDVQAGTVSGFGTIGAAMTNAGQVIVGGNGATGVLYVTGNYTQTSTGHLHLEIGGTTVGTQYDQLRVGGKAKIDGLIHVKFINGFKPAVGSVFKIVTADSGSTYPAPALLDLPDPGNGHRLVAKVVSGDLILESV